MNVGDYVRTKNGEIGKLVNVEVYYVLGQNDKDKYSCVLFKNDYVPALVLNDFIIKKGQLIDLIEVGDYVNGLPVESIGGIWNDENDIRVWLGVATYGKKSDLPNHKYVVKDEFENDYDLKFRCITPKDIKSIVTKEQFENMEYKI